MIKISPISYKNITKPSTFKNNFIPFKGNLSQKADTFEYSASKTKTADDELKALPSAPIEAQAMHNRAQETKQEGINLFEKVKQRASEIKDEVYNIYDNEIEDETIERIGKSDDIEVMTENTPDGFPLRRSTFINGVLVFIDEYNNNSLNRYVYIGDGMLYRCDEGIEYLPNGDKKIKRIFGAHSLDLDSYCKDVMEYSDGTTCVAKRCIIGHSYIENSRYFSNNQLYNCERQITYDDNQTPKEYREDVHSLDSEHEEKRRFGFPKW